MPITPSAINLKEILRRVYALEKDRVDLAWRRACVLAAQDCKGSGRDLSEADRETLRAVTDPGQPLQAVFSDKRLRYTVMGDCYEQAMVETLRDEAQYLGRSALKKTAFLVMCEAFVECAPGVVPGVYFGDARDWELVLRKYCEWLLTGGGIPDPNADPRFVDFDAEYCVEVDGWFKSLEAAQFADALLKKLRDECPEECREMKPPIPPGGGRRSAARRRAREPKALTAKQLEAAQIVGECKGNIAEAARRLGRDPATIRQHHDAAMKKLGKAVVRKPRTRRLPTDREGQVTTSRDLKRDRRQD